MEIFSKNKLCKEKTHIVGTPSLLEIFEKKMGGGLGSDFFHKKGRVGKIEGGGYFLKRG